MAAQEALQLAVVFFMEQGTGGQKHPAAGFQYRPQVVEHGFLLAGGFAVVGRPAQPFDVGVAFGYAGGGARDVGQDGVKRVAIIP